MWCSVQFCSLSLELHGRRWPPHEPSCFSPCQASCSRQLCFLSHTLKIISCTIDDSRGYIQHDTFTEPTAEVVLPSRHPLVIILVDDMSETALSSRQRHASDNFALMLRETDASLGETWADHIFPNRTSCCPEGRGKHRSVGAVRH